MEISLLPLDVKCYIFSFLRLGPSRYKHFWDARSAPHPRPDPWIALLYARDPTSSRTPFRLLYVHFLKPPLHECVPLSSGLSSVKIGANSRFDLPRFAQVIQASPARHSLKKIEIFGIKSSPAPNLDAIGTLLASLCRLRSLSLLLSPDRDDDDEVSSSGGFLRETLRRFLQSEERERDLDCLEIGKPSRAGERHPRDPDVLGFGRREDIAMCLRLLFGVDGGGQQEQMGMDVEEEKTKRRKKKKLSLRSCMVGADQIRKVSHRLHTLVLERCDVMGGGGGVGGVGGVEMDVGGIPRESSLRVLRYRSRIMSRSRFNPSPVPPLPFDKILRPIAFESIQSLTVQGQYADVDALHPIATDFPRLERLEMSHCSFALCHDYEVYPFGPVDDLTGRLSDVIPPNLRELNMRDSVLPRRKEGYYGPFDESCLIALLTPFLAENRGLRVLKIDRIFPSRSGLHIDIPVPVFEAICDLPSLEVLSVGGELFDYFPEMKDDLLHDRMERDRRERAELLRQRCCAWQYPCLLLLCCFCLCCCAEDDD